MKVRRLGIDLSEARLKAIALELGITKVYSTMTQAEKAQLRYHAIMTQTTKAQGDMARTLDAPANQLRILQAAATQAARAIGNVFIPILNAILPYAIVAANAVRIIASALASVLGFSMPSVDYSGLNGAANAAGKLNENLGGAGGSAKELKNVLMGFDEINKLPDASSGGGGGGAGGGGGGDFDFELLTYDFIGDAVSKRVDQLMAKIQHAVDWFRRNIKDIWPIVQAIGGSLLAWKLARNFIPDLTLATGYMSTIKEYAATLASMVIGVGISFYLDKKKLAAGDDVNVGEVVASALSKYMGSAVTGGIVKYTTGSTSAAIFAASTQLLISTGLSFVAQYNDLVKGEEYDSANLLNDLEGLLNGTIIGAGIGFLVGGPAGVLAGAGVGAAISFATSLLVNIKASEVRQSLLSRLTLRRGVKVTAEELDDFIQNQFGFDVVARIKVLDSHIENMAEAKEKLDAATQTFSSNLEVIKIGAQFDPDELIPELTASVTGENGILAKMQKVFEAEENQLKALLTIAPPISTDAGNENYAAELFDSLNLSSQTIMNSMQHLGTKLGELLQKSITSELSAREVEMVMDISNTMLRVEQAIMGQAANADFLKNVNQINWADLSEEGFEYATQQLSGYVEEYRQSLTELYAGAYADWQTKLLAQSELKNIYQKGLEFSLEIGDVEGAEIARKQLELIENSIGSLNQTLSEFDLDATIASEMSNILGVIAPNILSGLDKYLADFPLEDRLNEFAEAVKDMEDETMGQILRSLGKADAQEFVLNDLWNVYAASSADGMTKVYMKTLLGPLKDLYPLFNFELGNLIAEHLLTESQAEKMLQPASHVMAQVLPEAVLGSAEEIESAAPEFYSAVAKVFELTEDEARELLPLSKFTGAIQMNVWDAQKLLLNTLDQAYGNAMLEIETQMNNAGHYLADGIAEGAEAQMFSSLMQEKLTNMFEEPIRVFNSVNRINSPSKVFEEATSWIVKAIINELSTLKTELEKNDVFSSIKSHFDTIKAKVYETAAALDSIPDNTSFSISFNGYSTALTRIKKVQDAIRSISSATARITIKASVDSKSRQFLLKLAEVTKGSDLSTKLGELIDIGAYASGGFPARGDIFIANENGPELVGRIGNKTAVANEDQIGDTILSYMEQAETSSGSSSIDEERLANVLVRALRSAGVGAVRIDGKDIARSLNRETQRTGHTPLTIK